MANKYETIGKASKKAYEDSTWETTNKQIAELQTQRDENVTSATEQMEDSKKETDKSYLDVINSAAIQKELDLRDIRETRANMGLSRSGLSQTEQTAAILSAGNKTARAQRQRQEAIDALEKSLMEYTREQDTSLRQNTLALKTKAESAIAKNNTEVDKHVMQLQSDDYQAGLDYSEKMATLSRNAEKDRISGLNYLKETNSIGENLWSYAYLNGLSSKEALKEAAFTYNIASDLTSLYQEYDSYKGKSLLERFGLQVNQTDKKEAIAKSLIGKYRAGEISATVLSHMIDRYGIDEKILDTIE